MIKIEGIEYRNLQEQVAKNASDIADLGESIAEELSGKQDKLTAGSNITINGARISVSSEPRFSNIIVDNGTSGLYVNSLGDAGFEYVMGGLEAEVRIHQGCPELINRSEGYQASLIVGTQDIEIEKRDIALQTVTRRSLFADEGTKLYKHNILALWDNNSPQNFILWSTMATPITTQALFDAAYEGLISDTDPVYSSVFLMLALGTDPLYPLQVIWISTSHKWGPSGIAFDAFIDDTVTEL